MVHSRQPQSFVALHAPPPDQGVLDRVVERMADMQAAGHVGRRDDDRVRAAIARRIHFEIAGCHPAVVEARLYRSRRVLRRETARLLTGVGVGHGLKSTNTQRLQTTEFAGRWQALLPPVRNHIAAAGTTREAGACGLSSSPTTPPSKLVGSPGGSAT